MERMMTGACLPRRRTALSLQPLAWWEHAFGWSMLLDAALARLGWPEDWPYDTMRTLPHGDG